MASNSGDATNSVDVKTVLKEIEKVATAWEQNTHQNGYHWIAMIARLKLDGKDEEIANIFSKMRE